ncbi:MAG TPA: ABC transporter substrate-binding protein [Stellaceae bacterium]|nr:ABC transporter substrate-binding protein [Stellaceae bacterium]
MRTTAGTRKTKCRFPFQDWRFWTYGAALASSLFLAFSVCAPPASAAALKTLKVGIPGNSVDFARWFIAKDKGFFQKNGLDVTFVHLAANTLPAALVSNGIQATPLSTSVLSGNLAGFKVKLVGETNTKLDYMIIADKSIKSVADLKHKTIVTGPPKGGPNALLVYVLTKGGLDPKKDVKLIYIGSEAARRTLILAHNADAIIDDVAHGLELEEKMPSLHTLVATSQMPEGFGSSPGMSEDVIKNDPDLVKRMLRALAETKIFIESHPDETAALVQKELTLSPSIAKKATAVVIASLAPSLVPTDAMYTGQAEIESMLMGKKITTARIKAAWDTRLAAEVEKELSAK